MLSKPELARYLIGLVEVNDADLIDDDSILSPEICAAVDRVAIRRLRDMIQHLYRDFDYLASPEFTAMANGKSDALRAMLARRWSDPERQTEQRKKLAHSLASLLSDDRAYELTPPECHKILDGLRVGFGSVTNPGGDNAG